MSSSVFYTAILKKYLRELLTVISALLLCGCSQSKDVSPHQAVSRYAQFDGMRIHYLNQGTGREALIFVHGWTCNNTFWRFQFPAFEKNRRWIALDLPGHGKSDKPEIPYTQDLFASAVNCVIEDAGVDNAILVGHSMGFPVARQYIRNYPGKATGIVIVDGAFFRIPKDPLARQKWKKDFEKFVGLLSGPKSKEFTTQFLYSTFVEQTSAELREEITSKSFETPRHVAISAMKGMGDPKVWQEDSISVRALAIYAKKPNLSPDNGKYLRALFPNLEYYEWNGVGHFLMMEKPKEFNEALMKFLDQGQ